MRGKFKSFLTFSYEMNMSKWISNNLVSIVIVDIKSIFGNLHV